MARRFELSVCRIAFTAFVVFAGASSASAMGYWNLPGNFCQWLGCGYSGGYHACYALGPINGGCCNAWNETRLPYAPNPYACAPNYGAGCGGYGRGVQSPTMIPTEHQAATEPQAMLPAAAGPTLFAAPVQR